MAPRIESNKSSISSCSSFASSIDFNPTKDPIEIVNKVTNLLKENPKLNPKFKPF